MFQFRLFRIKTSIKGHPRSARDPGRYSVARIQRSIRTTYEPCGDRPAADFYTSRIFYSKEDGRILKADFDVDSRDLLVTSTSFNRSDWSCISCDALHKIERGIVSSGIRRTSHYCH